MIKPTKPKLVIAVFAVAGLLSVNAFCQEEPVASEQVIEELDANKDNLIDKEECKPNEEISANFELIDTNEDGAINQEELDKYLNREKKG